MLQHPDCRPSSGFTPSSTRRNAVPSCQVAIMQARFVDGEMGIVVQVIDAIGIEGSAPHQTMDFIALGEQKCGKV